MTDKNEIGSRQNDETISLCDESQSRITEYFDCIVAPYQKCKLNNICTY